MGIAADLINAAIRSLNTLFYFGGDFRRLSTAPGSGFQLRVGSRVHAAPPAGNGSTPVR